MSETVADEYVEHFISLLRETTINWAKRHDIWSQAWLKDPMDHYNDDPGEGGPLLLLCAEGEILYVLEYDTTEAQELQRELEELGAYLEFDDRTTAGYYLIESDSELQKAADRLANWRWMCRLIEADTADVSADLYRYFADRPDDFHKLPHRSFEMLVSSIFAARGWRTELGPGSGDGGVDLRIWQSDPIGDLLTLVQIKRYAKHNPIQLEAVAALEAHVGRQGANRGLFVTSSRYLPGVEKFAARDSRLILADSIDLARWCNESAREVLAAKNRAIALSELNPLLASFAIKGTDPRLVVGGFSYPSFCVVLRETRTSALLASLPSKIVSGDWQWGSAVPILTQGLCSPSSIEEMVFRATRQEKEGRVSYWGHRELYTVWNGAPVQFNHMD